MGLECMHQGGVMHRDIKVNAISYIRGLIHRCLMFGCLKLLFVVAVVAVDVGTVV